jgi:death-on-curing protein
VENPESYLWLEIPTVLALHEMSILRFGGSRGMRDRGLLESAMSRPRNLLFCGEGVIVADLAAACLAGIVQNHPVVDGNKRAGLAAAGAFLGRNGWDLEADQLELFALVVSVAAGEVEEEVVAIWIAGKLTRLKS